MGLEETVSRQHTLPSPPLFSPCLRTLGRSLAVKVRDFDLGWQLLNREALLTPARGAPSVSLTKVEANGRMCVLSSKTSFRAKPLLVGCPMWFVPASEELEPSFFNWDDEAEPARLPRDMGGLGWLLSPGCATSPLFRWACEWPAVKADPHTQ